MPRKLEDIIAQVRAAAGAFKPAGINIATDDLLALCEAAERSTRERNAGRDRMGDTYVVPASATHGPR